MTEHAPPKLTLDRLRELLAEFADAPVSLELRSNHELSVVDSMRSLAAFVRAFEDPEGLHLMFAFPNIAPSLDGSRSYSVHRRSFRVRSVARDDIDWIVESDSWTLRLTAPFPDLSEWESRALTELEAIPEGVARAREVTTDDIESRGTEILAGFAGAI